MIVLATYNIKGGVGKTASAVNLAYLSARDGFRTLLWDLDPQGAATFYFRVNPKIKGGGKKLVGGKSRLEARIRATDFPGLDLLPADFSYRKMDLFLDRRKKPVKRIAQLLKPLADQYEHVFLDCAPSISLVSESVIAAADVLLVPSIPTTLSHRTLKQLRAHLRKRGLKKSQALGFFCMVDRRKKLHLQMCESAAEMPLPMLNTAIPNSTFVEQMGLRRAPLMTYAPNSEPARAYVDLWSEIRRLNRRR